MIVEQGQTMSTIDETRAALKEREHHEERWLPDKIILDIETAPLPEAMDYIKAMNPPKTMSREATIDEWRQKQLQRAALDLDLCQIVAIGVMYGDGKWHRVMREGVQPMTEAEMINWWCFYNEWEVVGYNVLWDLRVIKRRAMYLDVMGLQPRQTGKYRHEGTVDICQVLSEFGEEAMRPLDFYAKRMGITRDNPLASEMIPWAVEAGEWGQIEAHLKDDLRVTGEIANKLGVFEAGWVSSWL